MRVQTVIGVDIGGSKTHGIRAVDGHPVAEAVAGSANLAAVGAEEAGRQLAAVFTRLDASETEAVCVGAAGADGTESIATITRLVTGLVPGARVRVVHDARLVLAAEGLDEGAALISGTGSVAWGRRTDGTHARAGGWGHLLGDEGSGYRVAIDAVRHALDGMDAGVPADPLTTALVSDCGLTDRTELIDFVYGRQDRRYWAERAAVVARLAAQGDPAATRIVDDAADALAALATRVLERLDLPGPVVLGGGFAVHQPLVQQAVRTRLAGAEVHLLTHPPAVGALRLAAALPRPAMETL
jgi:N-acetylglucosamine kinase-like BadF-type ATPase